MQKKWFVLMFLFEIYYKNVIIYPQHCRAYGREETEDIRYSGSFKMILIDFGLSVG
jgi:hypothetical protein